MTAMQPGLGVWDERWVRRRVLTADRPTSVAAEAFAVPWAALLIPHAVDPTVAFPDDTLQVFVRLRWWAPLPADEAVEFEATTRWVSIRDSTSAGEIATGVTARCNGRTLAEALLVSRATPARGAVSFGTRDVPRMPDPSGAVPVSRLSFTGALVAQFAMASGAAHPLHTDAEAARRSGFDDVLVQGLLLVLAVAAAAGVTTGPAGHVETWFKHPLTVRSGASLSRRDDVWAIHDDQEHVVAVARASPAHVGTEP